MPMTITHQKSNTIADWSGTVTVANSTGGTTTLAASNMVRPSDWNSGHATTLSLTGAEIASLFTFRSGLSQTTNASGMSIGIAAEEYFEPFPMLQSNSINDAPGMGTWYFYPVNIPFAMGPGRINIFCQRDSSIFLNGVSANSTSLGGMSATALFRNCLALYSQGTGANVTRLESYWTGECAVSATVSQSYAGATSGMTVSNYLTMGMISHIDTAGGTTSTGITGSGTFSTGTTSMASTAPNSLITVPQNWFTGSCMDIVPMATTIGAAVYWVGHMFTTGSGGAGTTGVNRTANYTFFNGSNSRAGQLQVNLSGFKRLGSTTSPNSTSQWVAFQGSLGTTTSNATSVLASSNLQAYSRRVYWNFVQDTK